ncbi:hypothetical protein AgCh_019107 [Apium graveolens]
MTNEYKESYNYWRNGYKDIHGDKYGSIHVTQHGDDKVSNMFNDDNVNATFVSCNVPKSGVSRQLEMCVGVGEWEAMSLRHHHHQSESLFDCEQDEEELKLTKILDSYVKKLVESPNLSDDATEKIKEMIIGDSKLVAALTPLVFERLVEILVDDKVNELTKGSAACILGFVKFDECDVGLKEKAIKVLVKLMSDDHDIISIPVIFTLSPFYDDDKESMNAPPIKNTKGL